MSKEKLAWQNLPLGHLGEAAGRSLVEASAGTGKTWTIAVLYLRLLLEERLRPKQIIVSTFTNAAAAELSQRLRQRMLEALSLARARQDGLPPLPSDLADWLQARWSDPVQGDADCRQDVQHLQMALAELDAAPISTLHSLCSRILGEHPFAAGALFNGRKLVDAQPLQAALGRDLRRIIDQGDGSSALERAAEQAELRGPSGAAISNYLPVLLQSQVQVCSDAPPPDVFAAAQVDAAALAASIASVIEEDSYFHKGRKQRPVWRTLAQTIAQDLAEASLYCFDGTVMEVLAKAQSGLVKAGKDDATVMAICEQSQALAEAAAHICTTQPVQVDLHSQPALRSFLQLAQSWAQTQMQARLDASHQSTFDALIESVHRSLYAPGSGLAQALFAAWPVCLVDEFQDTDPLQFGILDAIYRCPHSGAERGRLVMIGDPKQAIYRFRGGDIAAYLQAVAQLKGGPAHLSLDTNFRSSPDLIAGMNALYSTAGPELAPKGLSIGIAYQEVKAKTDSAASLSDAAGQAQPKALQLHMLGAEDWANLGPAKAREDAALESCARAIAHELSPQGRRIGGQPLQPGQIAVLLPTHNQVLSLAAKLKRRGLPCVLTARSSVFDGEAAQQLRLLLHAVLRPQDASGLRAALLSPLLGTDWAQLQSWQDDEVAWAQQVQRFLRWQQVLQQLGPLAWLAEVMEEQAPRLLAYQEGERMLTDLRHLAELLQEAQASVGPGEALAQWLAQQCEGLGDEEEQASDSRSLRLESDGQRIKLMTLHASKGLEFDIVYLPTLWKHGNGKTRSFGLLSDSADAPSAQPRKYLMLNKAAGLLQVAAQEREERYRLLYVALTRAVHACHVFGVAPQDPEGEEAAAKEAGKLAAEVPLQEMLWRDGVAAALQAEAHIAWHDGWPQSEPSRSTAQPAPASAAGQARALPAPSSAPWRMTHSFSGITHQPAAQPLARSQAEPEESPAHDELPPQTAAPSQPSSEASPAPSMAEPHPELAALADVAGAHFGNAVHGILERCQPQQPLAEQMDLVLAQLSQHSVYRPGQESAADAEGARALLAQQLAQRLHTVLHTPLGHAQGPVLAQVAPQDWLPEMEFNIHLDSLRLQALRQACAQHGEPDLLPAHIDGQRLLAGRLKGLIDLLFVHEGRVCVLDWKTNRLGPAEAQSLSHYHGAALHDAMQAHHYRLQALLYTVAVERYLRQRLGPRYQRSQHLGDCYYLFVRAVGLHDADYPQPEANGVWQHRFSDALLDAVQAAIAGEQP